MPTARCLQRNALPPSSQPPEFLVVAGASLVHLPFDRSAVHAGVRRICSSRSTFAQLSVVCGRVNCIPCLSRGQEGWQEAHAISTARLATRGALSFKALPPCRLPLSASRASRHFILVSSSAFAA